MLKVVRNLKNTTIILVFALLLSIPFALSIKKDTSALSGGTIDADVRVHPSLTLNLTSGGTALSDINLELDPASNPFDYQDVNVAVGTNNSAGYVLTMSAPSSDLVNVADSTKTIPTLSSACASGCTETDFPANHWGYKKDTGNYIPFDATGTTPLLSNAGRTNEDSTTLRFAAKVDYTNPSGRYEQDLVFTITANMATYYMQDLDPAICSTDPIEAIDTRDNNTYWVAELADGNCWMLQNLQLGNELATTTGSMTLTPANSNVSQDWVLTNKVANGIMPATRITDDISGEELGIYDANAFYCTPDSTNLYESCYYNWYTATAGSGTSNVTGKGTTGVDVNESICPRGWVLPKGGTSSDNDFQKLYQAMGSPVATEILVSPTNATDNSSGSFRPGFLLSGSYFTGGSFSMDREAFYQSRTAYSNATFSTLYVSNTRTDPATNPAKYYGFVVRCLRETRKIGDIQNMQDISPAIVANTNKESSTTLKDTRDNQEYTVAKLKDGKVWMTQNLRLGTGVNSVTITPTNSNVSADFTLNVDADGKMPPAAVNSEDRYNSGATTYVSNNQPAYYCTPVSGNNYVGCYYNWYTATAGADGNEQITPVGDDSGLGYVDVNHSICPKGWYLPSGGGAPLSGSTSDRPNSDFNILYRDYPSAGAMLVDNPTTTYNNTSGLPKPGFLLSGYYHSNGAAVIGQNSDYWSRSAYSKGMAYYLGLNSSVVTPQNYSNKFYGMSVRCLAY